MPVTRVISVIACLIGALGAAPSTAVAQDTVTFLALGSDADEVVGQGSNTYFDAATADFVVDHFSGAHRHFISIIVRPKDGSDAWSSRVYDTGVPGITRWKVLRDRDAGIRLCRDRSDRCRRVLRTSHRQFHHP